MKNFAELGLNEAILNSVKELNFSEPTEIQEKAIPIVLKGNDVIAGSATGSGKTLVFGAGIIQNCSRGKGIQALILTPTRELAEQLGRQIKKLARHSPLNFVTVYGGVSIGPQIEKLRSADVVVGTPGRVLDHLERRTVSFRKIKILVLDEADRMLDMGFIDDIRKIISQCSNDRQTMLFSATIMPEISKLAARYMKNSVKISAIAHVDPKKLTQVYYDVPEKLKFSLLVHLLKNERSKLVMVFCNSRRSVDFVANNLKSNSVAAHAIHAGFSQNQRSRVMELFHQGKVNVLICTDVAARGLDIKGVSHVYNYDLPADSKQYIHRIGRTARAGKEGKAINLLSPRDFENFDRILRENDVHIKKEDTPKIDVLRIRRVESSSGRQFGQKFFKGRRKQQSRRY